MASTDAPAPTEVGAYPYAPEFGPIPSFLGGSYAGPPWLTHVVSAVDWLGKRFHIGDKVLYCIGTGGRRQCMAVGVVKAIRARQIHEYNHAGTTQARLPAVWEIEVQVLTERTSRVGNNKSSRPAWVNPRNITALPVEAP